MITRRNVAMITAAVVISIGGAVATWWIYLPLTGSRPLSEKPSSFSTPPVVATNQKTSEPVRVDVAPTPEPYQEKNGQLPLGYLGTNAEIFSQAVMPSLNKILRKRDQFETTAEFAKRSSLATFEPSPANAADLYAFKVHNTNDSDGKDGRPILCCAAISFTYDANREMIDVHAVKVINETICSDSSRDWQSDANEQRRLSKIAGQDHPILCRLRENGLSIAISSKNKVFQYNLVRQPDYTRYYITLKDKFKVKRDIAKQLPRDVLDQIQVGVLFVGRIDMNLNISDFDWYIRSVGHAVPFNLKHIVYYDVTTGTILHKRNY